MFEVRPKMKPPPEDGSLEKITSSGLNPEFNAIIIQRTDQFEEPDGAIYAFATLDRTREGVEWPGDQILEKLIPELPKVKTLEMNKTDVMAKTNTLHRHHTERKFYQRPMQKNNYFTTARRPKPHQKRFRSERSENPSSFNEIDPWVCKPWENRAFFPRMNTTSSASATSLISTAPFNNFYVPTCTSSLLFAPRTSSNIFSVPNSSTYEKNFRPIAAPNIPFINNNSGHLNRPPPTNRMPIIPHPSFPLPNRFPQHPGRGFCGPVPNVDFNGPSRNAGLLGESPTARYQGSRDSHKTNYGRFEKPFAGVSHSKSGYKEMDDNPCESSFTGSQISGASKTSVMNNRKRNQKKDSLIHISNSAVVYNPEDFQNDGFPAAATKSTSSSNLNLVSRSNIRRNIHAKNTRGRKRQWTANKFNNNNYYRPDRGEYNQGQQRFKKRRTPQ
ncbi:unnamed protein product [Larinioides sclopetarius]|uniref:Uncharacterized protein n=1 Tax=Larinioides sclopetarius TaxID=280406 RepID=A0AAV1ZVB3_9ARAC